MERSENISQQSGGWQDVFFGQWRQMRGTLRSWWGGLTEDDWERIAGHKDRLLGMLQEKYGYPKDMAQREIERRFGEYWGQPAGGHNGGSVSQCGQEAMEDLSQKASEAYSGVKAKAQEYGSAAIEKVGEA